MRVEVLLERSSDVIVHEDVTETQALDTQFGVVCGDVDYVYPLANLSWVKVIGGEHYGDND